MKIRKTATQQNVVIDKWAYTNKELELMEQAGEITNLFPGHEDNYRIFTSDLAELKVICEDGFYTTVAIGKNGKQYYVNL